MKDFGNGFTLVDKSIYRYDSETFTSLKKVIDYDSFELVEAYKDKTFYFKDRNRVYVTSYMCTPSVIEGANPKTFKVIDTEEGIGFDGNNYYWYQETLPYDYSKAEKYNEYYVRVGQQVFFFTIFVDGADADTFSIIWQNIARDKDSLFFKGVKEPLVDIDTFKMVPGCFDDFHLDQSHTYYAANKDNVYFINTISRGLKKLSGVKPAEFSVKIVDERLYGLTPKGYYYFGIKKKGDIPQ
ncbi:hypothetical protein AM493_16775 [Flavobacterium akiainvivens]|uniref:DKNYY family protein n=1 Tax=Flavobacterium akiainvivens TaxID=1202724 RepID=A0A0M8MCV2_9FLAO|nr:DKNYY domain-containing protein [Flavobacterium akiainvivens]KOS07515.1 hypothetical protein AM493_16775 [Flavobacterium akiainvivens]SFQ63865.1 DKNYY family protein [Flavobacterium akiainvivens]